MTEHLLIMKNPYPHYLPDECVEQKFVNPQWEAWEEAREQFVKWGNETCTHHLEEIPRHICGICWQALLKTGGGK